MKVRTAVVFLLCLAFAAASAEAKRSSGKKKRYNSPASVERVVRTAAPADKRDSATLCNGGPMITTDDQIKGCSALLSSRVGRERKAIAHYNRGNAYFEKSDLARAIGDYSEALTYRADYAQAYFNRALANRLSGQLPAAINDYTAALALHPDDADALVGRGAVHARLSQAEKALADFNRALMLKPGHTDALVQRGHHFVRAHEWTTALADYETALAAAPMTLEALYGRGVAKVYAGDVRAGQTDIAQAVAFDSAVASRMTTIGIPPPRIIETAEERPIERRSAPEPVQAERDRDAVPSPAS
jgi:tetratricopeptide (TPR) repeat protein